MAQVTFRNKYITESTFDGGVLEISINNGAFTDIITAGGSFVTGGYNATISTAWQSPIAGRMAWSGTSTGGYITTVANLPAAAAGQPIKLRFRMASDCSIASTGWWVDGVVVTDCPPPDYSIEGTVTYWSAPCPSPRPVPNATMTLSGDASDSTTTDGTGYYIFPTVPAAGNYTVTPSRAAIPAGSWAGITTSAVIRVQQHFLGPPNPALTGCGLAAADVNEDTAVNTIDATGIQQWVVILPLPASNKTGEWRFVPGNRMYNTGVTTNQTNQDYDAYVLGDVLNTGAAFPVAPDRVTPPRLSGAGATLANVIKAPSQARVSLPSTVIDASTGNFTVAVSVSKIAASEKLISFQGEFTFDSRVVGFQSRAVSPAGLTAGGGSLLANVLGDGPIKTLRVSYVGSANLEGSGVLFNLNMVRVGKSGASTGLNWSGAPNHFFFVDQELRERAPVSLPQGNITIRSSSASR
jgi:hypothetical protein